MISIKQKGNFNKITDFFNKLNKKSRLGVQAEQIANKCISELKRATPKDSGLTADSWDYKVKIKGDITTIEFINTNLQNGMNVALLLEFGHGTPSGKWVEGKDYIEPIIQKNYLDIVNNGWKEMTEL
jgi:hypothetical protein